MDMAIESSATEQVFSMSRPPCAAKTLLYRAAKFLGNRSQRSASPHQLIEVADLNQLLLSFVEPKAAREKEVRKARHILGRPIRFTPRLAPFPDRNVVFFVVRARGIGDGPRRAAGRLGRCAR